MTSGIEAVACPEPRPRTIAEALQTFAASAGTDRAYEERITHPALPDTLFAKGRLGRKKDGTLTRHQSFPIEEVIEIGEDAISIRRPQENFEDTLPFDEAGIPLIGLLRILVEGRFQQHDNAYRTIFLSDANGWSVTLSPTSTGDAFATATVRGCADTLISLTIKMHSGETRTLSFPSS